MHNFFSGSFAVNEQTGAYDLPLHEKKSWLSFWVPPPVTLCSVCVVGNSVEQGIAPPTKPPPKMLLFQLTSETNRITRVR